MKKLELMKGPFSPKEKIEYAEGSIVSQEFIHNRANVPHSVHAVKAFKMLLIMIKG